MRKRELMWGKERGGGKKKKSRENTVWTPKPVPYHEMTYSCSSNIPVSFPIANSTDLRGHWVEWDQAYIWMARPIYPVLAESTSNVPLLGSLIPWGNIPSVSISVVWWPYCRSNFSLTLGAAPKDCSEKGGRKKPFKVSRSSKMTLHDIKAGRQRGKTKHRSRVDRAWGLPPCVWGCWRRGAGSGALQERLVARSLLCSCPSVKLSSPRDLRSNQELCNMNICLKSFCCGKN